MAQHRWCYLKVTPWSEWYWKKSCFALTAESLIDPLAANRSIRDFLSAGESLLKLLQHLWYRPWNCTWRWVWEMFWTFCSATSSFIKILVGLLLKSRVMAEASSPSTASLIVSASSNSPGPSLEELNGINSVSSTSANHWCNQPRNDLQVPGQKFYSHNTFCLFRRPNPLRSWRRWEECPAWYHNSTHLSTMGFW